VRVSATSGDANLKTSAFTNTDGSVVVVVLNTGSSAISTNYTLGDVGVSNGTVASYVTNESSSMAAQSSVPLSGGAFSATVPARSLVTYRITGGAGPASPSASSASASVSAPASSSAGPSSSAPAGGCGAVYTITNTWNGGFQANVTVTNNGSTTLTGWTVRWALAPGQTITQLWSGTLSVGANGGVTVTPASYNASVEAHASTMFGFLANGPATPPTTITCTSP
jgi:glucuronoarabinoxylan endo-1,4-beta-xylanase